MNFEYKICYFCPPGLSVLFDIQSVSRLRVSPGKKMYPSSGMPVYICSPNQSKEQYK